jgi:endonuclease/exonuclease/phosphatase family metal-dependent hydrolase
MSLPLQLPTRARSLAALLFTACLPLNYPNPNVPRYAGSSDILPPSSERVTARNLRLVTFNTKFALQTDSAIALLTSTLELSNADIVALQEADAAATERIAHALGMNWVYYPATRNPRTGRDFGNALLSRWPVIDDEKVVLPHLGQFARTQRSATAATILVNGVELRVYSTHLATWVELGPGRKRDQVRTILADAARYPRAIILGDMNSHGIGRQLVERGYCWPTEHNPRTVKFWNWDHIFLKGLVRCDAGATGVVAGRRHASDHRAVWAEIAIGPAR